MNHDVFISYSKKDAERIKPLLDALTAAGIKYWIDDRIDGAKNFLTEIPDAIKKCSIVLFVASQNSANSEWTQKELIYARSKGKEIFPYKLDDFKFENCAELDFFFTNIQWKENVEEVVTGLAKKLGVKIPVQPSVVIPASVPISTPKHNIVKRYWWVALCLLAVGCAIWYIITGRVENVDTHPIKSGTSVVSVVQNVASESEEDLELYTEKMRIEKENEPLKQNNAVVTPDLQKSINEYKVKDAQNKAKEVKETQQTQNMTKESQVYKSTAQNKRESKSFASTQNAAATSTLKVDQKSERTASVENVSQDIESDSRASVEIKVEQKQTQEQVEPEVDTQMETFGKEVVGFVDEYVGRTETEKRLLNLPDSEFVRFVKSNKKYYYVGYKLKSTGEVVIAPSKYSAAADFSEGLARVHLDDEWGFIDKTGKEVIPLKYDFAWSFSEGLAPVRLGGKWSLIDKMGNEIVALKNYDSVGSFFEEGTALVELDDKWGLIDKTGKEVVDCKYDDCTDFIQSIGLLRVKLGEKWGLIDKKTGKEVVFPKYHRICMDFSEGLAVVELDGRWGFIDKTGVEVIRLEYDMVNDFKKGKSKVLLDGKWFYIDRNGNRIR